MFNRKQEIHRRQKERKKLNIHQCDRSCDCTSTQCVNESLSTSTIMRPVLVEISNNNGVQFMSDDNGTMGSEQIQKNWNFPTEHFKKAFKLNPFGYACEISNRL